MKTPRIIAALTLFAVCVPAFAAAPAQPYRFAPAANWIEVANELPLTAAAVEQGQTDYLLVDHQVRLSKVTEHYQRYVERLVSQSSVDASAQVSIEIDPEHERLLLHDVHVIRAGKVIDKLADSRRSLLHREEELDDRLINGRVTLHMLLQDVRVGDVLDYSYTVERTDPISERGYNDTFATQWVVPVRRFRLRVLRPDDRLLQVRDLSKLAPPAETRNGAWNVTTWDAADITAQQDEDGKPAWFFLYPRIELSEFLDWEAVRDWSLPMYAVRQARDPALDDFVAQLKTEPDEATRILKALRFVQDDIRYTGIEIGAGAYRPTQPATVLARRFGDCKDKVLLFVTILRALGVDAWPALVHSSIGRGIAQRLPSPGAFDHVIAKMHWKDRDYWLDATASGQGGDLDTLVQADFGLALLLKPGALGLDSIPVRGSEQADSDVFETYDFRKGESEPASVRVISEYRSAEADSMRATMRTNTVTQLGKQYLDYYRKSYPGVSMTKPLEIKDDRAANLFTVEENYSIDTPFEENDDGEREFVLEAYLVSERTGKPKLTDRTTPLARSFPMHVRHKIVAYLSGEWNIKNRGLKLRDPAFEYTSRVRFKNGKLELNFDLRNTRDHVAVDELKAFLAKLDKAHDDAYYTLTDGTPAPDPTASGNSVEVVLATLLGLGVGAWASVFLWNLNPPVRAALPYAPAGLVGWLVLPVIGVCTAPFFVVSLLVDWYSNIGGDAVFRALKPAQQYLALVEVGTLGAALVLSCIQPVLLFRHRSSFPHAYIAGKALWVVAVAVGCIAALVNTNVATEEKGQRVYLLLIGVASAALWISYMLVSQRVRATFVRDSKGAYPRTAPVGAAPA